MIDHPSLGDIVAIRGLPAALWEVVEDVFYEEVPRINGTRRANVKVVFWAIDPDYKPSDGERNRYRCIVRGKPYRVEVNELVAPQSMMVVALSAQDPIPASERKLPWNA